VLLSSAQLGLSRSPTGAKGEATGRHLLALSGARHRMLGHIGTGLRSMAHAAVRFTTARTLPAACTWSAHAASAPRREDRRGLCTEAAPPANVRDALALWPHQSPSVLAFFEESGGFSKLPKEVQVCPPTLTAHPTSRSCHPHPSTHQSTPFTC
jgi:hypothetical protein